MRFARILISTFLVAGLMVTGGGLYALHTTLNSLLSGTERHTALTLLGHEYRTTALELQRLAKDMVLQGDSGRHETYTALLATQRGAAPRPHDAPVAPGRQSAHVELARQQGASESELHLLREARTRLDALRDREAPYLATLLQNHAPAAQEPAPPFDAAYERDMAAALDALEQFSLRVTQRATMQADAERDRLFVILLMLCFSVLAMVMGMSGLAYVSQIKPTGPKTEIVRFYVSIVVILLGALFVPAWLTYNTASQNFTAAMEKRQTLVVQEIVRELNLRFEHGHQFAQILATRPPVRQVLQHPLPADPDAKAEARHVQRLLAAREVLESFTQGYADTSRVALLDHQGDVVLSSWNLGLRAGEALIPQQDFDRLRATEALLASIVYQNHPVPVVVVPVKDEAARTLGYIAMIVDVDGKNAIWNNRLEGRERMNIFILDHKAHVVSSSNPNWKPGFDAGDTFAGKAARDNREGLFRYVGDDGQERLGVYLRLPHLQWLVGVSSSERIIFNEVQNLLVSSILLNSFASFSALALVTILLLRLVAYLRRGEERLSLVIQGAEIGLWDLDVRSQRFHHNEYWALLFGEKALRDEKPLEWFMEACHPDDRQGLRDALHTTLASVQNGTLHHVCRLRHADGGTYWRYATGRVIERDKAGHPLRLTGTLIDIHARKMAEMNEEEQRELLEAQIRLRTRELEESRNAALAATRAKSDFLSTMSHEIRTPMNAIIGFTHLFEKQNLTNKQLNYIEKIKISAGTLLCVINDVLDLSKIEAGKLEVEVMPFQLHSVVNAVHSIVGFAARDKHLDLEVHLCEGVPEWTLGDPTRLQQILLNLMSNAVKFTPEGFVRLTVRPATSDELPPQSTLSLANAVTFEVTDSGIGVAPEHMDKLFSPFTQADSSVTRRFGGTGLGLAICRQLAELMGGVIRARSRVGHGTTFYVTVPLPAVAPPETARTGDAAASPTLAESSLVLVVDDNAINQEIAKALLEAEGLMVDVVDNGEEAITQVCRQRYDLVFMDLQMPVMDGLEATRRIRALGRDEAATLGHLTTLPIIAMTANAMQEDKQRCMAAGMDGHIGKPIEPELLHNVLLHWLVPQNC